VFLDFGFELFGLVDEFDEFGVSFGEAAGAEFFDIEGGLSPRE